MGLCCGSCRLCASRPWSSRMLEQQLGAPDTAVTSDYIYILAKFETELGQEHLPDYPKDDQQKQDAWRELYQKRSEQLEDIEDDLYRTRPRWCAEKVGICKAEIVRTSSSCVPHIPPATPEPLLPTCRREIPHSRRSAPCHPTNRKASSPSSGSGSYILAMVAPLEEIAQQPYIRNSELRDVALLRLYQTECNCGNAPPPPPPPPPPHPHIDNNISTVSGNTLGLLPNETLPQFDYGPGCAA